jgi:hypothetical protein
MATKSTEKIIEALSLLLEGYAELQEDVGDDDVDIDDDDEEEETEVSESGLVHEVRTAIESVMEGEDYSSADIASLLSTVTEALQEIDPSVFEDAEEEVEEEDEDEDFEVDDDDDEYDVDDDDDEEDEDSEEEDEDEDSDDDEEDDEDE